MPNLKRAHCWICSKLWLIDSNFCLATTVAFDAKEFFWVSLSEFAKGKLSERIWVRSLYRPSYKQWKTEENSSVQSIRDLPDLPQAKWVNIKGLHGQELELDIPGSTQLLKTLSISLLLSAVIWPLPFYRLAPHSVRLSHMPLSSSPGPALGHHLTLRRGFGKCFQYFLFHMLYSDGLNSSWHARS